MAAPSPSNKKPNSTVDPVFDKLLRRANAGQRPGPSAPPELPHDVSQFQKLKQQINHYQTQHRVSTVPFTVQFQEDVRRFWRNRWRWLGLAVGLTAVQCAGQAYLWYYYTPPGTHFSAAMEPWQTARQWLSYKTAHQEVPLLVMLWKKIQRRNNEYYPTMVVPEPYTPSQLRSHFWLFFIELDHAAAMCDDRLYYYWQLKSFKWLSVFERLKSSTRVEPPPQ